MTIGTRLRTAGAAILALASLTACGSWVPRLIAPQGEYLAYRKVRIAEKIEPRLASSETYLRRYPHGAWDAEVRSWFDPTEEKYFASQRESNAGLASYLNVLPAGPHAEQAKAMLALRREEARKQAKEELEERARLTEERLAARALAREKARETVTGWLGRTFAIGTWGDRDSYAGSAFFSAWNGEPPTPQCNSDRCTKTVPLPFAMPGTGEDTKRMMVLDVVIALENGGLAEARLQGPGLFSRLYEASTAKPVRPNDGSARVAAIAFAVEVVGGAAEARLPGTRCSQDVVAPVVMSRGCDGWALEVRAAMVAEGDDEIVVRGPRGQ